MTASPTAPSTEASEPVAKPPPYAYIYEWDGPFGTHQSTSSARYNGMAPNRSVPVWTTPPPAPVLSDAEERAEFEAWLITRKTSPINQPEWFEIWQAARASKGTP